MASSSTIHGPPSNPAGVTGRLATWVHDVKISDIPDAVVERAKYLILDGLACALVGARLPWADRAVSALSAVEPAGPCSIIGWGTDARFSPMATSLLNGTFIQGFELDDFHSRGPIHSNSVLLPALFAAIDSAAAPPSRSPLASSHPSQKFTGLEFLRAFIIGHEVGPRIGMALYGSDLLARGWHSGSLQGPSSAAAAVGTLLGFSPRQIEWALGTACTQAGGLTSARFGSDTKRMQHAFAARNGLLAAYLTRDAFIGIEDVYEAPHGGFLDVFGQGSFKEPKTLPERIVDGLGTRWEIEADRVKLYAAMGGLLGPIDAVAALQEKYPEKVKVENVKENVKEITVELSNSITKHGGWIAPKDKPLAAMAAQMSVQYSIAAQLVDGQVLMKQYDKDNLNRPLVRQLMDKVRPVHNPKFDEKSETKFSTRVAFEFEDGSVIAEELSEPKSFSASNDDILQKWRELVKDVLSDEKREKLEKLVLGIEKVEDMTKLTLALTKPVKCPIEL